MTETTNSARDQPNPKVDITPETIYNLIKLVEQNAPLLALLENHKPGPQDALKSEPKGASDMAKRHKQRVRIGTDEKGAAIYKWADGHSVEELFAHYTVYDLRALAPGAVVEFDYADGNVYNVRNTTGAMFISGIILSGGPDDVWRITRSPEAAPARPTSALTGGGSTSIHSPARVSTIPRCRS